MKSMAEVTVDSVLGNDTSCQPVSSIGILPVDPCRTLNRALGAVSESSCSNTTCASGDLEGFDGLLVRLADGVHTLTGETVHGSGLSVAEDNV